MRRVAMALWFLWMLTAWSEAASCPTTQDIRSYATQMGFDERASLEELPLVFEVPPGCPVVIPNATIRTPAAEKLIVADLAKAKALVAGRENELSICRAGIPKLERECQEKLDKAAARNTELQRQLASIPEPPSRTTWALIGAGSTAVAIIIYGSIRGWSP